MLCLSVCQKRFWKGKTTSQTQVKIKSPTLDFSFMLVLVIVCASSCLCFLIGFGVQRPFYNHWTTKSIHQKQFVLHLSWSPTKKNAGALQRLPLLLLSFVLAAPSAETQDNSLAARNVWLLHHLQAILSGDTLNGKQ